MKIFGHFIVLGLLILSSIEWNGVSAQSTTKPLWAQRGVKSLNNKRISKDYHFVSFHNEVVNSSPVQTSPLSLMRVNIGKEFGVSPEQIRIDSIVPADGGRVTYSVTFPSPSADELTTVYVQEVDSYSRYNDNINGSYDYDMYNLYALSDKDITPTFDDFEVTRKYNGVPLAMSLIPGLGQIYKGQSAKGYTIIGAEVVFVGAIVFGELNRSYYMKKGRENPEFYESWKSKASTFSTVRNIGIIFAGATYLYNIFDAAFAKGAPHVLIKQPNSSPIKMAFTPVATPWSFGAGMTITF